MSEALQIARELLHAIRELTMEIRTLRTETAMTLEEVRLLRRMGVESCSS